MKKQENQIDGQYTYFAFICYTHADYPAAKKLRNKLQRYGLPTKLAKAKNKSKHLIPIFLDDKDMLTGIYNHVDHLALKESKYLIVICSSNLHSHDTTVNEEIEQFLSYGNSFDSIIPFIIDDVPNPEQTCFPGKLVEINRDEKINIIGASVFSPDNKRQYKNAYLKVIAKIHNIKTQELENAHKKRRFKRIITSISTATGLLLIISIIFILLYVKILNQNNKILLQNSEGLCRESELLWNNGNTHEAIEKALSAISENKDDPYDKYSSYLLSEELGAFSEKCLIKRTKMPQKYDVNDLLFFNNGKSIFSRDRAGVYFWNTESSKKKKFISNKDLGKSNESFYLKQHNEKYVTLRSSDYTVILDCTSQKIALKKLESSREIAECPNFRYSVRYDIIDNTLYTEKPIIIEAEKISSNKIIDTINLSELFEKNLRKPDMLLENIENVYYNPKIKEALVITSDDSYGYIFSVKSDSLNVMKKYKIDDYYTSIGTDSYNCIANDKGNKLFFTYVTERKLHTLCIDSVTHKLIWENTENNVLSTLSNLTSGFFEDGLNRYYYYFNANKLTLLNADSGKHLMKNEFISDIVSCVPYKNKLIIINKGFYSELKLSAQKNFRFTNVYTIPNNITTASYYDGILIYSGDTSINLVKYGRNKHFVDITDKYGINDNQEYYPNPTDDYDIIKSDRTLYVYSKNTLNRIKEPKSSVYENIVGYTKGFLFLWNSNKNQLEKFDLSTKQTIHKTTCKGSLTGPPKIIGSYIVSSDEKKTYYYDLDLNDISEKFSVVKREATDNIPLCLTKNLICTTKNDYLYIYDIEQSRKIKTLNIRKGSEDYPVYTCYLGDIDMLVTVCSNDVVYCFKDFVKNLDSFSIDESIPLKIDGLNNGKFKERAISVSCIPEKNSLVLTKEAGTPYPTAYFYEIDSFKKIFEVKNYQGYSKSRGIYVFNRINEKKYGILQMRDKPSEGFYPFYSIEDLVKKATNSKENHQ